MDNLTYKQARDSSRTILKNIRDKNKKYDAEISQLNLGFSPLIFEITGKMDANTIRVLNDSLEFGSISLQIPFPTFWRYWIAAVMMTLQRGLADGITKRCYELYSRKLIPNYELDRSTVYDSIYVNVGNNRPM